MALEIERRFVFKCAPAVLELESRYIRQVYLTRHGDPNIRLREMDNRFSLTFKWSSRLENTCREYEFRVPGLLAPVCRRMLRWPQLVEKRRYYAGRWELDLFFGRHNGICFAECELSHADEPLPAWPEKMGQLLGEIKRAHGLSNRRLAFLSRQEIDQRISRVIKSQAA